MCRNTGTFGELGASFITSGFTAGGVFLGMITNPFNFDRGGSFGPAQSFAAEDATPSALPDDIALAYASILKGPAAPPPSFVARWSAWGSAYGGSGTINGDPAVAGTHDVTSQVYGFAGGVDYRAMADTFVGFTLGGGGTNWNLAQRLGSSRSNIFQVGAYASSRWGPYYVQVTRQVANMFIDGRPRYPQ